MSGPTHNDTQWRDIQRNASFQELVQKRSRFAMTLSVIMLSLYMAFILLIAFAPGVLGTPLAQGMTTTWGILIGLGLILVAIVLTGLYVRRANGEFDRLNARVLEEISQ
ncbi:MULTISPECIES: DUF485 domain-containing protein [Kushneria]|uniref:Uncharacterized protein n=2 Tax=Kushneria TaxID=504090 RepID=A0A240UMA3_9GAMM|nr:MULTISPECIES: DUF485 domain-containing protein [Kushneria]ARS53011.1 hypothetical protein B9G99_09040 [Kushneria konosiri]ART62624.1 hypothetical protein B9H00_05815 [Kushneria marisflavi]RKD83987.1 uncharacterized membrane protein (DUF485 family) [Kushneria marisflavi]